ncbi:MAG: NADH-quinone oxidoreductase subunit L [Elusimicrobiota bacterium]
MTALPIEAVLLFAAPVCAILISFFLVRPWKPRWTHWPILVSCAVVAVSAVRLALRVYSGGAFDVTVFQWMSTGQWGLSFGLRLDGLSSAVLAMVAVVGALIHVYAAGYMEEDENFSRFFLFFHLFYLAMIGLLTSDNYIQLYLFWEMVGMASYYLIGFWYHKTSARRAALQAFLVNRVGDFGFMLAALFIVSAFPQSGGRFAEVFPALSKAGSGTVAAIGYLLFWAATAKSAQFPLYFWLPDAMEGPTPVSALMHAATMVTAGIFLLARSWPLISTVPHLPHLIAWIGAITALGSGIVASTKTDLKRILAYSTVSHLGIMALGVGLGEVGAGIFHLITHGFFKAVLFLCAGNIAHGLGKPTASVNEAGGLLKKMPLTFVCFTAAALSLAGIWPFAGFYSKDAILDAARAAGPAFALAGAVIGALSAFYIFRMLFLVFLGPRPRQEGGHHIHEAGAWMAAPVFLIAIGAVAVGWFGAQLQSLLSQGWLAAVPAAVPHVELLESWRGLLAALIGAILAYWLTTVKPDWDWNWRENSPALLAVFESDFGWKPAMAALARGVASLGEWLGVSVDKGTLDRAIEGCARGAVRAGDAGSELSNGSMNNYVWWMAAGVAVILFAVIL